MDDCLTDLYSCPVDRDVCPTDGDDAHSCQTDSHICGEADAGPDISFDKVAAATALAVDAHNLVIDGAVAILKDEKILSKLTKTTGLLGASLGMFVAARDIMLNGANASNLTSFGLGVASAAITIWVGGAIFQVAAVVVDAITIAKDTYDASHLK